MDDAGQTMLNNLPAKTGRTLDAWFTELDAQGLTAHRAMLNHLKKAHGVTHGYANTIATLALRRGESQDADDLIAAQYLKKPALRPLYDQLLAAMAGIDFEVVPKKTAVAWKHGKQFAYLQPSTKTRLDVGIQLKGEAETPRLKARKGMTSHVVGVTQSSDIDEELIGWLKLAWERCA